MDSKACLETAPTVATDYKPQGRADKIAGYDCYVSHKESPSIGIISIYDAFGASTLGHLGIDLLASNLDAVVIEPDILRGDVSQDSWYPLTDETKGLASAWRDRLFGTPWEERVGPIRDVVKEASVKFGITHWGVTGYCLGGKISVLCSGKDTPFKASVAVHPGGMDIKDAHALTIPHRVMASKDEPAEVVEQYEAWFKEHPELHGEAEIYQQPHGWAAARAKLDDPEGKKGFEKAYDDITKFFQKHV